MMIRSLLRRRHRRLGPAGVLTIVLSAIVVTTSCSVEPNDLPSVRAGVGPAFPITLEFASALNLPAGSDITLNGHRVGQVNEVSVLPDRVEVSAEVARTVALPAGTRATMRQNTLLGDTYIALTPPIESAGAVLGEGATIPLRDTSSPPQLEDTIAVLAYFVNGGSITRVQNAITRVNAVMPDPDELDKLATIVSTDLKDLDRHTGEVDRMLDAMVDTTAAIDADSERWQAFFGEESTHFWRRTAESIVAHISQILPSVGSVYEGGLWLIPMFESLSGLAVDGRSTYDGVGRSGTALSNFLRTTVLPFAAAPNVDVVGISDGDESLIGDAETVLRMLGVLH